VDGLVATAGFESGESTSSAPGGGAGIVGTVGRGKRPGHTGVHTAKLPMLLADLPSIPAGTPNNPWAYRAKSEVSYNELTPEARRCLHGLVLDLSASGSNICPWTNPFRYKDLAIRCGVTHVNSVTHWMQELGEAGIVTGGCQFSTNQGKFARVRLAPTRLLEMLLAVAQELAAHIPASVVGVGRHLKQPNPSPDTNILALKGLDLAEWPELRRMPWLADFVQQLGQEAVQEALDRVAYHAARDKRVESRHAILRYNLSGRGYTDPGPDYVLRAQKSLAEAAHQAVQAEQQATEVRGAEKDREFRQFVQALSEAARTEIRQEAAQRVATEVAKLPTLPGGWRARLLSSFEEEIMKRKYLEEFPDRT
jgi:hypothetical protein